MSLRLLTLLTLAALSAALVPMAVPAAAQAQPEPTVQEFLEAQPGPLKSFQEGNETAAMVIESRSEYYALSPRLYLTLLEAVASLLSNPAPPAEALRKPYGPGGPDGFIAQIEWASRELRAGLGPYDAPPTLRFSDGTTITLTLQQAPEGVAVQRFLANGRTQAEWRDAVDRFNQAFASYFNNQLPPAGPAQAPPAPGGFLMLPWPDGVRVRHLAYFDHVYPTVDSGDDGNSFVVDYLGRSDPAIQYDGHDGHDFVFLDEPIGTPILAAAPGVAYAIAAQGLGVVIQHAGGYETVYWHLDTFAPIFDGKVSRGAGVTVNAGDVIGTSGRSGFVQGTPHLHFEVRLKTGPTDRIGKQVDPYGWYGQGTDPCAAYAGCLASSWLWHGSLSGKYDFTPPGTAAVPDTTPPIATLTAQPRAGLRLMVRFDGHAVQQVGNGFAVIEGQPEYRPAHAGQGVLLPASAGLSYPSAGNIYSETGTLAFWASLPGSYPANTTRHHYLFASSANSEDPAGIFAGTLALRRDLDNGGPAWNFWTVANEGVRDDLRVPDTLGPGLHHFALTWDRGQGEKILYLDGVAVAQRKDVQLPAQIGELLEVGRFTSGAGHSDAVIDELSIFDRVLGPLAIAALAQRPGELTAGVTQLQTREILIDVNAYDASGIDKVQLGIDGRWEPPKPYYDAYRWTLPSISGTLVLGARFFDRAGNSTIVSTSVELALRGLFLPLIQYTHGQDETAHSAQLATRNHAVYLPLISRRSQDDEE